MYVSCEKDGREPHPRPHRRNHSRLIQHKISFNSLPGAVVAALVVRRVFLAVLGNASIAVVTAIRVCVWTVLSDDDGVPLKQKLR